MTQVHASFWGHAVALVERLQLALLIQHSDQLLLQARHIYL